MSQRIFQLDIECTDTDPKHDDILQIAFLEAYLVNGYWHPGKSFNTILPSEKKPETQFAKENMADLFSQSNALFELEGPVNSEGVRQSILKFFKDCGATPPNVFLMGWNVTMLDLPFLLEHKILEPYYRQTIGGVDIATGDFHYRVYEQSGSISLAQSVLNERGRNDLVEEAFAAYPEIKMPLGKEHDALFDCYRQLRVENGLVRLVRKRASSVDLLEDE